MKVLVVAAHPDDEVLGCGGTIARHVAKGDEAKAIFMTDGVSSRLPVTGASPAWGRRQVAAHRAAEVLGLMLPSAVLGFGDNRMDDGPLLDVVQMIEGGVSSFAPDIIYTHHAGDLNIDHQITHQAVMTACRPMPGSTVKAIYAFEVPSSTEWASDQSFRPNYFVDISSTLDKKMEALKAYNEEMRDFPHPRSYEAVEALAKWRGASVGLQAAEAFMTLRRIEA
jgi:LmbE family N-acetylglucosaminyl deacetylase